MSILRQRLHRMNQSGTYDTIYFESESSITVRPNGESVEKALTDLESVAPRCASQIPKKLAPGQLYVTSNAAYVGLMDGTPLHIGSISDREDDGLTFVESFTEEDWVD